MPSLTIFAMILRVSESSCSRARFGGNVLVIMTSSNHQHANPQTNTKAITQPNLIRSVFSVADLSIPNPADDVKVEVSGDEVAFCMIYDSSI